MCDRRAVGRRSVRRGKAFERAVASKINEVVGTRYRRSRLGATQPLGDLVPDESRALRPGGAAERFESLLHVECKSNLCFSWASLLAGKPTILDTVLEETASKAIMTTSPAVRHLLVVFGHEGRTYVVMYAVSFDSLAVEMQAGGLTAAPALRTDKKVILTLDGFLRGLVTRDA